MPLAAARPARPVAPAVPVEKAEKSLAGAELALTIAAALFLAVLLVLRPGLAHAGEGGLTISGGAVDAGDEPRALLAPSDLAKLSDRFDILTTESHAIRGQLAGREAVIQKLSAEIATLRASGGRTPAVVSKVQGLQSRHEGLVREAEELRARAQRLEREASVVALRLVENLRASKSGLASGDASVAQRETLSARLRTLRAWLGRHPVTATQAQASVKTAMTPDGGLELKSFRETSEEYDYLDDMRLRLETERRQLAERVQFLERRERLAQRSNEFERDADAFNPWGGSGTRTQNRSNAAQTTADAIRGLAPTSAALSAVPGGVVVAAPAPMPTRAPINSVSTQDRVGPSNDVASSALRGSDWQNSEDVPALRQRARQLDAEIDVVRARQTQLANRLEFLRHTE
jgi:hypothetical protein